MTALLSILALLGAWAILTALERLPWPPQRPTAIYDQTYWQAVERDSVAYLATHSNVSSTTRQHVTGMAQTAQQRLGRVSR